MDATAGPPGEPHALPEPPAEELDAQLAKLPQFDASTTEGRLERARATLAAGRGAIVALHRAGASGRAVVRLTSELADRLVRGLFEAMRAETAACPCALVALGGYGRRELAPRSDLDLMLLLPDGAGEGHPAQALAERFLYALWDLKLEVGWSARTLAQCVAAAEEDHTARTALLDCRFVAGDAGAYARLEQAVLGELLEHSAERFIADKAEESCRRRERYGDTVYLLEPNVKQGEGGLRDLQSALWIAQARFRARGLTGLLQRSVLSPREVKALRAARDFLWRTRNALHLATGRREDRLTFDMQEQAAASLGYREGPWGLPVEQFMRDYYLCARQVKRSAGALVERCEEGRRATPVQERRIDADFKVRGDAVALNDADLFERDPLAVLRLFAAADEESLPLYRFARERVAHALPRFAQVAQSADAAQLLAKMMARPGSLGGFLPAMHELGVLGAVLPEFGRVTALRKHDLYHVYTVDVHSLFAVRRLYALRAGELLDAQPELTRLMQELERPLPLYLGMLFHDAGKGMGGQHSERGRELVAAVARRMGLCDEDRAEAELLVLKHLAMSHVSQRRDLSDPELIRGFAREVGSARRLTMLYLLTYADICSVGPTAWTEWKGRLLRELYEKALDAFGSPNGAASTSSRYVELRDRIAARVPYQEVDAFLRSMPHRYLATVTPARAVRHIKLLRRCRGRPLGALLLRHREDGYATLSLTAPDRPGLLSVFAGVLAAHEVAILSADVYSIALEPGGPARALDLFAVRGPRGEALARERFTEVKRDLRRVLSGQGAVGDLLARRAQSRLAPRPVPRVATRVKIDNTASRDFTVVDVVAQDRVGLLFAITDALHHAGVDVVAARIATEAHQANDAFYVRREGRKITDPVALMRLEADLQAALAAE